MAVVLTHRRRRLATGVVRHLIEEEGFLPRDIVLVVNGDGGLDDPALEAAIDVVHLPENLGPAGGFRAGLVHAMARPGVQWAYVCEDDIGLLSLDAPRLERLVARVSADGGPSVGAVVAYARVLNGRTGSTVPHAPHGTGLVEADVAAWGAALVSRRVVEAGVLPDPELFFGYEDFDFFLQMRARGFRLLLDADAYGAVAHEVTDQGRSAVFAGQRPTDVEEPWRSYYVARNFFVLSRRYGHLGWTAAHLAKSLRRLQLAPTGAHRRALALGLAHGLLRRTGRNDRFVRVTGERG